MTDQPPLLALEHVAFRYDTDAEPVLRDVNLVVHRGESLAVVGPSGCGKSTLLNIIGTLERPTAGRVALDGEDLDRLDPRQLAAVRNRKIGFIFQDHHLLPQCTVLENVLLPTLAGAQREKGDDGDAAMRAQRLLDRVGLSDRLHHRPGEVSGGQRQRAAVVRALINRPALLLADEPTGSLDRASAAGLAHLLVDLNREENVTLITVTHASDLAGMMGRTCEIRDGSLAELRGPVVQV